MPSRPGWKEESVLLRDYVGQLRRRQAGEHDVTGWWRETDAGLQVNFFERVLARIPRFFRTPDSTGPGAYPLIFSFDAEASLPARSLVSGLSVAYRRGNPVCLHSALLPRFFAGHSSRQQHPCSAVSGFRQKRQRPATTDAAARGTAQTTASLYANTLPLRESWFFLSPIETHRGAFGTSLLSPRSLKLDIPASPDFRRAQVRDAVARHLVCRVLCCRRHFEATLLANNDLIAVGAQLRQLRRWITPWVEWAVEESR
jgi:hypothetical protein